MHLDRFTPDVVSLSSPHQTLGSKSCSVRPWFQATYKATKAAATAVAGERSLLAGALKFAYELKPASRTPQLATPAGAGSEHELARV